MRLLPEKSMRKAYTQQLYAATRKPLRNVGCFGEISGPNGPRCVSSPGTASDFLTIGVDEQRLAIGADHRLVDHDLAHVLERGQLVHRVEQDLLEDRAQPASSRLSCQRPLRNGAERAGADFELHAFHMEQALVLLDERVLRLGQDQIGR